MLEAQHYGADAKRKGSYALPAEFDGTVNRAVLYQAVRAFRNNQRHGTHSTRTKGEVSGGNQKPWRQKGTGRARQGSIRAPHWVGGGVVFGPKPRDYRTDLPRKVKRLARQSALNQRAAEGAVHVIERLAFDEPKTRRLAELLEALALGGRKVLVLTAQASRPVYLSARNLRSVEVRRYQDVAAYDVLWADALLVEEEAIGGHAIRKETAGRAKRTQKAAAGTATKRAGRAVSKRRSAAKRTTKKAAKRATSASKATKKKKKKE